MSGLNLGATDGYFQLCGFMLFGKTPPCFVEPVFEPVEFGKSPSGMLFRQIIREEKISGFSQIDASNKIYLLSDIGINKIQPLLRKGEKEIVLFFGNNLKLYQGNNLKDVCWYILENHESDLTKNPFFATSVAIAANNRSAQLNYGIQSYNFLKRNLPYYAENWLLNGRLPEQVRKEIRLRSNLNSNSDSYKSDLDIADEIPFEQRIGVLSADHLPGVPLGLWTIDDKEYWIQEIDPPIIRKEHILRYNIIIGPIYNITGANPYFELKTIMNKVKILIDGPGEIKQLSDFVESINNLALHQIYETPGGPQKWERVNSIIKSLGKFDADLKSFEGILSKSIKRAFIIAVAKNPNLVDASLKEDVTTVVPDKACATLIEFFNLIRNTAVAIIRFEERARKTHDAGSSQN